MAVSTEVLGPGTLTIGETGTPIDASCLVNNCKITPVTKDQSPTPPPKLCGDEAAGAHHATRSALTGNV